MRRSVGGLAHPIAALCDCWRLAGAWRFRLSGGGAVSAQSLFILGGLLLLLAALAGGGLKVREVDIPKLATWARVVAGVAGVGTLALGLFPRLYAAPTSGATVSVPALSASTAPGSNASPSNLAPSTAATGDSATGSAAAGTVKILSPHDGGTVKLHDEVRIEANDVHPHQQVWIVVEFAGASRWFPQGPCKKVSAGVYECSSRIGDPSTRKGVLFSLSAQVVTSSSAVAYQPLYATGFEAADPPVTPVSVSATITVSRV